MRSGRAFSGLCLTPSSFCMPHLLMTAALFWHMALRALRLEDLCSFRAVSLRGAGPVARRSHCQSLQTRGCDSRCKRYRVKLGDVRLPGNRVVSVPVSCSHGKSTACPVAERIVGVERFWQRWMRSRHLRSTKLCDMMSQAKMRFEARRFVNFMSFLSTGEMFCTSLWCTHSLACEHICCYASSATQLPTGWAGGCLACQTSRNMLAQQLL